MAAANATASHANCSAGGLTAPMMTEPTAVAAQTGRTVPAFRSLDRGAVVTVP